MTSTHGTTAKLDSLVIGVSQQTPSPLDVRGTLQRLSDTAQQAADWDVQVLALPEMCITGYNITPAEISQVAERSDGPIFQFIAKLCQQHRDRKSVV